ncbi:hypothetical protein PQX77_001735, partial [Marasmius sp. AFHP31]
HASLIPNTKYFEEHGDSVGGGVEFTVATDEVIDTPESNEPEEGNETDDEEEYQLAAEVEHMDMTYCEEMEHLIRNLKSFTSGLEYQVQFRDKRFLTNLQRQGAGFLRIMGSCLEKEIRQNRDGGPPTGTWSAEMAPAMYYRTQPRRGEEET